MAAKRKAISSARRKFTIKVDQQRQAPGAPLRWVVGEPRRGLAKGYPVPDETVVWSVPPRYTANFQFPVGVVDNLPGKSKPLTVDNTAKVSGTSTEPRTLKLRIHHLAQQHRLYYYAVWIQKTGALGGEYAVGDSLNPPPEITVGP